MSQRRTQRQTQISLSQPSTSRANNSNEFDDDYGSLTQPQNKSMSDEEHAHNVGNAVKYIIAASHLKAPILRTNISKGINFQGSNFKAVMVSAKKILLDVFGYELLEVDTDKKSTGKYVLCNKIQNPYLDFGTHCKERYALLFIVLAHIFMNGEMCTQESLEAFLKQVGFIPESNEKSDIYGDVMELITGEFVKEKYISAKKSQTVDNEIELTWGERAMHEVSVRSVLEFIAQVYEAEPNNWQTQYQRMLEIEQERQPRAGGSQIPTQNGRRED